MNKYRKIWVTGLCLFLMVFLALAGNQNSPAEAASAYQDSEIEIEPDLLQQFQAAADSLNGDHQVGYLIYFEEKPDLSPAYNLDWEARGQFVVAALQDAATSAQQDVRNYLDANRISYQTFWIDNLILVEGSSQQVFNGLLSYAEISALRTRRMMAIPEPQLEKPGFKSEDIFPTVIESNIIHVNADDVWALGYRGDGIVVANIDTGVRGTHEILMRQYRGTATSSDDYNWLGAAGGNPSPIDDHSHGTHTMGTIVGEDYTLTNQTGMAPGAQWIACDGCEGTSCPDIALLACAEWIVAPYPTGEMHLANSDLRPHVVNNSWGDCGRSYDDWYQDSVDAWHAAGIYPVFSNGNSSNCSYSSPPGLNTVGNPARYGNVTGVGSTGQNNGAYATHSNWGPTDNLDMVNPNGYANLKPQVVAPGVSIRSATNSTDSAYSSWNGTSMSAPHVTGLVALMWQAAPCLIGNYAATETIIEQTATPIPYNSGNGDEGPGNVPNHATGWGEINALAAVQVAREYCSLDATPETQSICAPGEVKYEVRVGPGFTSPVTLSLIGNPTGTIPVFSPNPASPNSTSTLTITVSGLATSGDHSIDFIGNSASEIYSDTVALEIASAVPGSPALTTPGNTATDINVRPEMIWGAVSQAEQYQLEIAEDGGFSTLVYSATVTGTSHQISTWLNFNATYYWRVRAENFCGLSVFSTTYSFTTAASPAVLLVDDDDNNPDVQDYYSATLLALNYDFAIWDTENSDSEPPTYTLNSFDFVIWFTGDEWDVVTGPGVAAEAALASWLDTGERCFLISSQDYHYDRGLTNFMDTYLGVAAISDDQYQTIVTGTGFRFGTLGSFDLSYPFSNWSDIMTPDADASVAFDGNKGYAALKKNTGVYKTSFWTFPLESLPTASDRENALQTFFDWCGPVHIYLPLVVR
jgi:hypothetical protein